MAHRAHHRNRRMENRARHDFFVEFPKILDAPAAAREHDHVDRFPERTRRGELVECRRDFRRGAAALHAHRADEHLDIWRPPPEHVEHVANRRAARRCDNPDAFWKSRQRPLARGIEEAFCLEFSLQGFEFRLEQAGAARLQNLDAELVLPARFEDGDASVDLDLRAIGDGRRPHRQSIPEDDARDRGPLIFQREILMARGMQFVI